MKDLSAMSATIAADLTATDRVRWARWLLAPLAEDATVEAAAAIVAHGLCQRDRIAAGAPVAMCDEYGEARMAAVWRRDRLVGAVAEVDGWLQAAAAEARNGSVAA